MSTPIREDEIDITGCDLVALVKKVYELSRPQGLGFRHFQEGDSLSDEEAKRYIKDDSVFGVIRMDYVRGRACKFDVRKTEDGKLAIRNRWYDHNPAQLRELLTAVGISTEAVAA